MEPVLAIHYRISKRKTGSKIKHMYQLKIET
jgi:hypothetical protein